MLHHSHCTQAAVHDHPKILFYVRLEKNNTQGLSTDLEYKYAVRVKCLYNPSMGFIRN